MKQFGNKAIAIAPLGTADAELQEMVIIPNALATSLSTMFRQGEGVAGAVRKAVTPWKASHVGSTSSLISHGMNRCKELEAAVLQAIDHHVAQHDSQAEMAKLMSLMENCNPAREPAQYDEIYNKQYQFMLAKYGV